jgi:hypothetical protein
LERNAREEAFITLRPIPGSSLSDANALRCAREEETEKARRRLTDG